MAVLSKRFLYATSDEAGETELDYLNTNISSMDLETNERVRITAAFEGRPDLLSFRFYGNWNLGWLIAYHNDMLDPVEELTVGAIVDIPSLDSYYRFANRNKKRRSRR